MSEEREQLTPQESPTPRWVGIAVAALTGISLVALGAGWTASSRARALAQSLSAQTQALRQTQEIVAKRLAQAEETNAQLQGEVSVITGRMKLTQGELNRARYQAKKIREEANRKLAEVQNNVNGQLATKASADDVNKLGGDVQGVKTDLEATKSSLQMAKGEFGTLIARNHEQIEQLRQLGQRDYYEFTIERKGARQRVGDLVVELRGTNTKKNLFSVALYVDDMRYEKKNRSVNEPIYFYTRASRSPLEFVVNRVGKNKIIGYLSVPKGGAQQQQAQRSGN